MSKIFNNLSDGVLRMILTSMHERFEEDNIKIDLDDYYIYDGDSVVIINDILKYYSITNSGAEEWSFLISLYLDNPDYTNTDISIVRPKLMNYQVTHKEEVVVYKTNTYLSQVSSYLPLTENILHSMRQMGEYDYWDGRVIDQDVYDSDVNNDEITDIEQI